MTGSPRCSRDHVGWGRDMAMDRILSPGGGWACPGILLDGSDCGFEIGAVRDAPAGIKTGEPRPYAFTRDELVEALTRIELRPAGGKVAAGSMADAIIQALDDLADAR